MVGSKEIIKVLKENGFVIKSQRGSHVKLTKDDKTVIVPHPKKDVPVGTFRSIVKQSGLLQQNFEN